MGQIENDTGYLWERFGGWWWFTVTASRGSPAHHSGFAVGPVSAPRTGVAQSVCTALIIAAGEGEADFVEALGDIPVSNGGPFPGVVPATWYAELPALVRGALVEAGAAWADAGATP